MRDGTDVEETSKEHIFWSIRKWSLLLQNHLTDVTKVHFLCLQVRRTLSDVGMLISIILMVVVDYFIQDKTGVITEVSYTYLNLLVTNRMVNKWFRFRN